MPKLISLFLGIFLSMFLLSTSTPANTVTQIDQYNEELPLWGTAWGLGSSAIGNFYPSFYTGFAIRSEYPERIHVRQSRGNQIRVTVILDDKTISDYAFDLEKRSNFYRQLIQAGTLDVHPRGASIIPHQDYFSQIIDSNEYGIHDITQSVHNGNQNSEALYKANLEILKKLNSARIFELNINLKKEFLNWKNLLIQFLGTNDPSLADKDNQLVVALNSLVWGRINVVETPSSDVVLKLKRALHLINGNEQEFLVAARDLFIAVTGSKYDFKVLDDQGHWTKALQCENVDDCYLKYPEFTAIYPLGSLKAFVSDKFGNKVPNFASPGLWKFLDSNSSHAVDNIRNDGYYGWIPKMDYEKIGNGYHNPAVLFNGISRNVQESLGIDPSQDKFWSVMRGGVSHGCSRLPAGHIWELRHLMPVENNKMTQVYAFHNNPLDFDLYDVDGDGEPEVMGVEYLISYDLAGTSDVARREGTDLEVSVGKKIDFYKKLYGSKGVFDLDNDNRLIFKNPGYSMPSVIDLNKKTVKVRVTIKGNYKLYEQTYEKDKIQFYITKNGSPDRSIVRLLGRVRGCAPTSNKNECGETAFMQEASSLLKKGVK